MLKDQAMLGMEFRPEAYKACADPYKLGLSRLWEPQVRLGEYVEVLRVL